MLPISPVFFHLGSHPIHARAWLAPMAGVTDRPFRMLCRRLGAGLAFSEMMSSNPLLRDTLKSQRRMDHAGEAEPRAVQIAGSDPQQLAEFARYNVDHGAQIIDINMGCPAKKVCQVAAGSALLRDEDLVATILRAVVAAVPVPVTLKIRTGWSPENRNGVRIAKIAEDAGIAALTVHGRTRADAFNGSAEYDTIAAIKAAIRIPLIANGDIRTPQQARAVLAQTGADAVMIARAAQGNPFIFREINHYLHSGNLLPAPTRAEVAQTLLAHLQALYDFYGERDGVRIARKHLSWTLQRERDQHPLAGAFWQAVNQVDDCAQQWQCVKNYFDGTLISLPPLALAA